MVRRGVIAGVALLAALAVAEASPSAATRPVLRLVDTDPLVVQGLRFDPAATVRVQVLTTARRWTKQVEVGNGGRFVARFPAVETKRCGAWLAVLAVASDGTQAGLRLPQFECPKRR